MNKTHLKLNELRDELYQDYLNESNWIYVKMQSILEYVNKIYLEKLPDNKASMIYYNSNIHLTRFLLKEYYEKDTIMPEFQRVNHFANIVKHSADRDELKEVFFDKSLINSFIREYNNYCQLIFKKEYSKYLLNKKTMNVEKQISTYLEKEEKVNAVKQTETQQNLDKDSIFISCGFGYNDKGFYILGIEKSEECTDPNKSIYSVIYNYLQRNNKIDAKLDKPNFVKKTEESLNHVLNYRNIYRLMMIILAMIKNNYLNNNILSLDYEDKNELEIAFSTINEYIKRISKLMGIKKPTEIKFQKDSSNKISVDGSRTSRIYVVDNKDNELKNRTIWFAPQIRYRVSNDNKSDLEFFLKDISIYTTFKDGQFESLKEMLNGKSHKLSIMPTGAGKSLIFYLTSLLQPGVTFVIAPTELLIEDQINNLNKLHRINDVRALKHDDEFVNLNLQNKLYYLTPETFQNRDLLKEFISFNSDNKIANIVLDEVHCISNWSHDFRPEYLMLSTYLNRYLNNTNFLCFTATANYSVVKDIKNQLHLKDNDILSPIKLEKNNIEFNFISYNSFEDMAFSSYQFLKKAVSIKEKTLVFTKSEHISDKLFDFLDDLKDEVEIYRDIDRRAYKSFASGHCKILIANEDLGVGINLSDVNNVLHFGLPISKAQYVQEIGRVGRNGEKATTLVVYMECTNENVDERLIKRNIDSPTLVEIINNIKRENDYISIYKKIIGNFGSQVEFYNSTNNIYNRIKHIDAWEEVEFDLEDIEKIKKSLYILFAIGLIHNWSLTYIDEINGKVTFLIGLKQDKFDLNNIKENTRKYIYLLGNYDNSIHKIGKAETIENILDLYISWYYNQFIYHHKEQFLDMLSFLETYKLDNTKQISNNKIYKHLASYFSLSMLEIGEDERKYAKLSFKEIANIIILGVKHSTVSNIERINQDKYNIKLDYFAFVYSLILDEKYDKNRMERILSNIDETIFIDFIESISLTYAKLDFKNKFQIFKDIFNLIEDKNLNFIMFFDMLFRTNVKDFIYYGVLAKEINSKTRGFKNVQ